MLKKLAYISLFALLAFMQQPRKFTIWMIGDSTMSVKDPKAYPETGWGMPFAQFFDSTKVTVNNLARNGRSTRTFREEGLWQPALDNMKEGDYLFIQFGHNDEVPTKAAATSQEQFRANLTRYINEAMDKKVVPVLLTPVARRKFNADGALEDTHKIYAEIIKEVAKALHAGLIDIDAESRMLLKKLGPEESKKLYLWLKPGEHPNYPNGKQDDTHFSEAGAAKMAELVLENVRYMYSRLGNAVIKSKSN